MGGEGGRHTFSSAADVSTLRLQTHVDDDTSGVALSSARFFWKRNRGSQPALGGYGQLRCKWTTVLARAARGGMASHPQWRKARAAWRRLKLYSA